MGDLPAFCAIVTSLPMCFCWILQRPVIRRGRIHPSERKYWLRISTSVCLMSSPNVHFGQKCSFLTSFSRWLSRGDGRYSPDMVIELGSSLMLTEKKRFFLKINQSCCPRCLWTKSKSTWYLYKRDFVVDYWCR